MLYLDDYQEESSFFLSDHQFALLADAPGVGKTAPAIVSAYGQARDTGRPAVITAPAYLLPNWEYEIGRFAPDATVVRADGAGMDARREALSADADFVLTSYNNWSATHKPTPDSRPIVSYPELVSTEWSALLYDEGHRLRGRNSRSTKQVFALRGAKSRNRQTPIWFLTGTPIVNNPGDLFPLFKLWKPSVYRSYWKFVDEWCDVVITPWGKQVGQLRRGKEDEFQELLSEFTLRRTLKDVPKLASLDEYHEHYFVSMPASVRKTIATARKEYIIEHEDLGATDFVSGGGALYTKLRQLATDPPTVAKPKLDILRDFLEDHNGHIVIYVWYKSSARAVEKALLRTNRPVTTITGDVPSGDRQGLVDQWGQSDGAILVATISSLKEGISLVAASTVIFVEHSELPADQEQCVARLKRRGQQRPVGVHHVWARGTPDIAIKRAVFDREEGLSRALKSWLIDG